MTLDAAEQKLVDDVARYGWQIMRVASAADEAYKPPFAYTIGLQTSLGWPELLCYGLDADVMSSLITNAIDELRDLAVPPTEGLILQEVANGFECKLSPVAPQHHSEHLGFAIWFAHHRGEDPADIRCLQLLWPDRDGRFPPDCSPGVQEMQPVLAE